MGKGRYWTIKSDVMSGRLNKMIRITDEVMSMEELPHLSFSEGNRKTDSLVPSISLRPILDCGNCASCCKSCYDFRNDLRFEEHYTSRAKNYAVWSKNPKLYFDEISLYVKRKVSFRWHVGGDIVNEEYLRGMVRVARENKHCRFLVFTKMFDLCNEFFANNRKPSNLQIIYSGWVGLEVPNPHNFPTSHPIFPDGTTSASDGAKLCTGNCSECLVSKSGCWTLKKGEQITFIAH